MHCADVSIRCTFCSPYPYAHFCFNGGSDILLAEYSGPSLLSKPRKLT